MIFTPKIKKQPQILTLHGNTRIDNYYWLRDDKRQDLAVLDYLSRENIYSETLMSENEVLRRQLATEMIDRIPHQDFSVPYICRGYRYQSYYKKGDEYSVYTRQPEKANPNNGRWEILLDSNQRATKSKFYSLGLLEINLDNQIMAVTEDFVSNRLYELRFKDLKYNFWFPEVIRSVSANFTWSNHPKILYYVRKREGTLLPYQVWRHVVGTLSIQDTLIYEEKDDTFYINVSKTTSERYVIVSLNSTTSSEVLLLDADNPIAKPEPFLIRRPNHKYHLDHYRGYFYIRSNKESKNFTIYCSENEKEGFWKTIISARKGVKIEKFFFFHDWLVLKERRMGMTNLRQVNRLTGEEKDIIGNDPTSVVWLAYNPDSKSELIRYNYSSMNTPTTLFEFNLKTSERKLLKRTRIKNCQTNHYCKKYLWIVVRDGVKVPVSLVYRKDLFKMNTNPLLVCGYGAYGKTMDPIFSASRLSLLDRGFICALAHIRGGGELGQAWHENGKLFNKMKSFYDFIDISYGLLNQGYGDSQLTFAMGGSAGGLLMGAVINLEPSLFKGVVAQVPFVDIITTMLDESVPLTTREYEEWGNPKDEACYYYMLQYSPYDQVQAQAYPHLLVTASLHDSQVQYWEPVKWVSKLRELKTDNHLLLLYTDMNAGHDGKSGRFNKYEEISKIYTFILMLTKS